MVMVDRDFKSSILDPYLDLSPDFLEGWSIFRRPFNNEEAVKLGTALFPIVAEKTA